MNHYKYMKQKVKSTNAKNGNKTFEDCLVEWNEEEDIEEKLTTRISVLEHYKRYTVKD